MCLQVREVEEEAPNQKQGSGEALMASLKIPQLSFLPVERPLLHSRIPAIIRNATKDDVMTMYGILKAAAARGEGYSVDEFPDLATFINLVMHYYSVIIEERDTGVVVGFVLFATTVFRRTEDCAIADCHVAINPNISGRGLGIDIVDTVMRCACQMGYKFMINDTPIIHTRAINITRKMNYKNIGTVPNVSYISGRGWEDCLYLLHDVGNYHRMLDSEAKPHQGAGSHPSSPGALAARPKSSKL